MRHIAVGLSLLLAGAVAGCDEHVASPDPEATGRAARRSAGQQIVAEGVARSGTEWLGNFLDTRGDDPSAGQLTALRAAHALTLDSVFAAPRSGATSSSAKTTMPTGAFASSPAFDDDEVLEYPPIILSTEYSGAAEVYQTTVLVTASGNSGSLTGGAAFKGDEVTITLAGETRNDVGSRPRSFSASNASTRRHDTEALVRCFERNTLRNTTAQASSANVFRLCAHYYQHYAEHSWPEISFGQPCGTMLTGQAFAVANYEFGFLFQLLSAVWTTIVRDPGPVAHSLVSESPVMQAWSGDCRPPVVIAEVGGPITRLSSNRYEARTDAGGGAMLHLYATRTDPGLPSANRSEIHLNGVFWESGTYSTAYLPVGTYELYTTVWDDLLGLSSESSAWIHVLTPPEVCADPAASNRGAAGSCIYPEDTCWDPEATNYGEYGACVYASDGYCWDSYATNYGAYGACFYAGDGYCWDWYADNYGQYGGCSYGGWPPSPCDEWDMSCNDPCSDWYMGWEACEDPCSDWYTGWDMCEDPCSDWYFGDEPCEDPCSDWYLGDEQCDCDQSPGAAFTPGRPTGGEGRGLSDYCDVYNRMPSTHVNVATSAQPRVAPTGDPDAGIAVRSATPAELKSKRALLARSRKGGAEAALHHRRENVAQRRSRSSYGIMLLDQWKDPSLLSMVGRFDHGGRYIDVIYLPAKNPTALGWAQAVRTLQRDRQLVPRGTGNDRVLRINGNGTERVSRTKGKNGSGETVTAWTPLPPAALQTTQAGFRKRILPQLQSAPIRTTRNQQSVRLIRWPR
jgi:hypothetical protein